MQKLYNLYVFLFFTIKIVKKKCLTNLTFKKIKLLVVFCKILLKQCFFLFSKNTFGKISTKQHPNYIIYIYIKNPCIMWLLRLKQTSQCTNILNYLIFKHQLLLINILSKYAQINV